MKNNEKKSLREIKEQLELFRNSIEEIKEEVDYRYNELEEKSPNSERLERLQSEGEKFEEVSDLLNDFETELEELIEGNY